MPKIKVSGDNIMDISMRLGLHRSTADISIYFRILRYTDDLLPGIKINIAANSYASREFGTLKEGLDYIRKYYNQVHKAQQQKKVKNA